MPDLYIITGSNGAGKSSTGSIYIPDSAKQHYGIFDGDKLFMEKRSEFWKNGIKSHKECKKLAFEFVEETFDKLVDDALAHNHSFAYEGHFTNDATWDIPRRFKVAGYTISIIFLGLVSTEVSQSRVIIRAKEGGHYVDPQTIADNFEGNLVKLDQYFEMFDYVQIMDTSIYHDTICIIKNGEIVLSVTDIKDLPTWFTKYLRVITQKVIDLLSSRSK